MSRKLLPVLGLQQRLGAGQPHARAEPAVEPQHDRLLQRLALGVGVGGQLVELDRVGHGLDRVLGHQPGLARLELAVVVLEGADRLLRDALRAHLLDARAQSVLAHGDDSSRRRNVPAPSTRAPSARTRAASSASEVTTSASRVRLDQPHDLVVGGVAPAPRRAHDGHRSDGAEQVVRTGVEDHRHGLALSPLSHLIDQRPHGPFTVAPPAVRTRTDHVHGVDEPAHSRPILATISADRSVRLGRGCRADRGSVLGRSMTSSRGARSGRLVRSAIAVAALASRAARGGAAAGRTPTSSSSRTSRSLPTRAATQGIPATIAQGDRQQAQGGFGPRAGLPLLPGLPPEERSSTACRARPRTSCTPIASRSPGFAAQLTAAAGRRAPARHRASRASGRTTLLQPQQAADDPDTRLGGFNGDGASYLRLTDQTAGLWKTARRPRQPQRRRRRRDRRRASTPASSPGIRASPTAATRSSASPTTRPPSGTAPARRATASRSPTATTS